MLFKMKIGATFVLSLELKRSTPYLKKTIFMRASQSHLYKYCHIKKLLFKRKIAIKKFFNAITFFYNIQYKMVLRYPRNIILFNFGNRYNNSKFNLNITILILNSLIFPTFLIRYTETCKCKCNTLLNFRLFLIFFQHSKQIFHYYYVYLFDIQFNYYNWNYVLFLYCVIIIYI